MKGANILSIIALVCIAVTLYLLHKNRSDDNARAGEIKKLKENFETIVNYDSIADAIEDKILDSLGRVREDLQIQIDLQRNENKKIRAKNAALEKRFRDLNLGDRPEF